MTVVDEIKTDSEAGTKRLESEYKVGLMAFARRFCHDEAEAEELVYRTFAEVVAGIDGYTEKSAFFGWMCKILSNCHTNDIRRRSNQRVVSVGELPETPDDGDLRVVEEVDAALLREAIEELPAKLKEAVLLRYFADLPILQIARFLMIPAGTVHSRLHMARMALAMRLGATLKKRPVVAVVAAAALFLVASAAVVVAVVGIENGEETRIENRELRIENDGDDSDVSRANSQFSIHNSQFSNGPLAAASTARTGCAPYQSADSSAALTAQGENQMNTNKVKSALLGIAAATSAALPLAATQYVWQGGTGTVDGWNVSSNWSPNGIPTGGDEAVFNNAVTISSAITIGSGALTITANDSVTFSGAISGAGGIVAKPMTANKVLYFSNTASTFTGQFRIAGVANAFTQVQRLADMGAPSSIGCGTAGVETRHESGKFKIVDTCSTDRPFYFSNTYNNDIFAGGTVTFTGAITGTALYTRTGTVRVMSDIPATFTMVSRTNAGTLVLGGAGSTFTATPSAVDGTLAFTSICDSGVACALGMGDTVAAGGNETITTLKYGGLVDAATDRTFNLVPHKSVNPGLRLYNSTAGTTLSMNGGIVFTRGWGFQFIEVGGEGDISFNTPLPANMFGLTKTGAGTVTLAADNLYPSNTVVSAGRLDVTGSTEAHSKVTVASGAVLGGTGTIHGEATVSGVLSAGTAAACGTLSFDAAERPLSFAAGAALLVKVGAGVNDSIAVTGTPSASGAVTVRLVALNGGDVPPGTYTVMTYDAPPADVFTLDSSVAGELSVGAAALTVTVRGSELLWSGNAANNVWDFMAVNWTGSVFANGADVVFSDAGVASVPVDVSESVSPATVRVTADSNAYAFAGRGKITGGASFAKIGAAALEIANTNDYTGATTLSAGRTTLSGKLEGTSIAVAGGATFHETASGVIAGEDIDLVFGHGSVVLEGTNTFSGRVVYDHSAASAATTMYFPESNSLGRAESVMVKPCSNGTTINASNVVDVSGKTLYVARGVGSYTLKTSFGKNFSWRGDIAVPDGEGQAPVFESHVANGAGCSLGSLNATTISGFKSLSFRDSGACRISGRIDGVGSVLFNEYGYRYLESTNNVCGSWNLYQGLLRADANGVFAANAVLNIGKGHSQPGHDSILNLNGTTQEVAQLVEVGTDPSGASGNRMVRSETPALLTVKSDEFDSSFGSVTVRGGVTRCGTIAGEISLVKDGEARFDLNASTNTFSGDVTVLDGILAANSPGSLGVGRGLPAKPARGEGDKLVSVLGGTLELNAAQFALTNMTVKIGAKNGTRGMVHIAQGVVQDVRCLEVEGKLRAMGVYGGYESAAPKKYACFSGKGVMRVSVGCSGFMMSIR